MKELSIDELARVIGNDLDKFAQKAQEILTDELVVACKKTAKDLGEYERREIEKSFMNAVGEFYGKYDPHSYERRESLYDVLDIKKDADGLVVIDSKKGPFMGLYDPSGTCYSRTEADGKSDNGALFESAFVRGYHGGSTKIATTKAKVWGKHPHTKVPYYRKSGWVTYPNGERKWHRYGRWGHKAKIMKTSSFSMVAHDVDYMWDNDREKVGQDILNTYVDETVNKVGPKLQDLFDKLF